jgi:hypothetical protein
MVQSEGIRSSKRAAYPLTPNFNISGLYRGHANERVFPQAHGEQMTFQIPETPDALLTRDHTAAALTASGFPVKAKTLATQATRGGGPPYPLFGPKPLYRCGDAFGIKSLYRWGASLVWARAFLSKPLTSTSELDRVSAT